MGNSEELERLAALREKGALTEEEFQKAKSDLLAPKKKRSTVRTILTWGLGLWIVYAAGSALLSVMGGSGGVPTCDSSDAKKTLMQAFDGSPFARTFNLSAIDVSKPAEAKYDSGKRARVCTALVKMNNTAEVSVKYNMERKEGGRFLLTFEVADANPSSQASAGSKVEQLASVSSSAPAAASQPIGETDGLVGLYSAKNTDSLDTPSQLKLSRSPDGKLKFEVVGFFRTNSGIVNTGEREGQLDVKDGKAEDKDSDCKLAFAFTPKFVEVSQDGLCGFGMNVRVDGKYKIKGPTFVQTASAYEALEKEINETWRTLMLKLNANAKAIVRKEQVEFNRQKESVCLAEADQAETSGQNWEEAKNKCWARFYQKRIPQLKAAMP